MSQISSEVTKSQISYSKSNPKSRQIVKTANSNFQWRIKIKKRRIGEKVTHLATLSFTI